MRSSLFVEPKQGRTLFFGKPGMFPAIDREEFRSEMETLSFGPVQYDSFVYYYPDEEVDVESFIQLVKELAT